MSWTRVQGAGVQAGAPTNSITATFGSATTPGNVIVARFTTFSNAAATPVFSDGHNTYNSDVVLNPGAATYQAGISHALVATGVTAVTLAWTLGSNTGYSSISIDEYSYTGTLSVDSTGTLAVGTRANATFGSALTVTGTDLVAAVLGTDASTATSPGTGATARYVANYATGAAEAISAEDYIGVTSNTTPAWTSTSNVCYAAAVAYTTAAVAAAGLFFPATLSLGSGGPFFQSPVNG